jgi:hypothetical protein
LQVLLWCIIHESAKSLFIYRFSWLQKAND